MIRKSLTKLSSILLSGTASLRIICAIPGRCKSITSTCNAFLFVTPHHDCRSLPICGGFLPPTTSPHRCSFKPDGGGVYIALLEFPLQRFASLWGFFFNLSLLRYLLRLCVAGGFTEFVRYRDVQALYVQQRAEPFTPLMWRGDSNL